MEKMDAYREKIQAQIKEWESLIDLLQARAGKATSNAKIEIQEAVEKLQAEKKNIQGRLAEMRTAGGEAWNNLQAGTEKAVAEMKSALEKAVAKFK